MTIYVMDLLNMLTKICYHTTNNLCDPLWWWEEHSHDLACSAPGSSPFLGELYATSGGQHTCNSGTLEREVILVSNLDIHLVANMIKGIHVWSPSWPVHDLHILLCQKNSHVTCCVGRDIVPKCPSPPKRHPIEVMPGVDLVVKGSTQYHQLTPPNIVCEHTIPEGPSLPSMVGCTYLSVSRPARGAHEHDHLYEKAWSETYH